MLIRSAVETDIPAIVELLRSSLGESLTAKSGAYWQWKHGDNPFGASPVLVAEAEGKLVGVRAFMRWGWHDRGTNYSAVRAVDTATHPDHQGKGIFKKLTLQLVEQCRLAGDHLVFNTPNGQSRPGYLKMGWQDAGRVPVQFYPLRYTGIVSALLSGEASKGNPGGTPLTELLKDADIPELLLQDRELRSGIITCYSKAYLQWRYVDVPVARYTGFRFRFQGGDSLVIGRMKASRMGNEFRLTDIFSSEVKIGRRVRREIYSFARSLGADYVTCSGTIRSRLSIGIGIRRGPMATVRALNLENLEAWKQFREWSPSLGDLELF